MLQPNSLTDVSTRDGATIVSVRGEIDIASADAFTEQLEAAGKTDANVIVSLAECPYIDSSGLRVLVRLSNELSDRCAVVVPPGTQTRRIFDITGLAYQMRVCDSLDAALAVLAEGSTNSP